MKEQFVTYEIALKLKNLGFNEFCMGFFYSEHIDELSDISLGTTTKVVEEMVNRFNCIKAPLWQQVIDWFREQYELSLELDASSNGLYNAHIYSITNSKFGYSVIVEIPQLNYYEAREQAILKALELITNK